MYALLKNISLAIKITISFSTAAVDTKRVFIYISDTGAPQCDPSIHREGPKKV
jgi:hypothetical protein